MTQNENENDSLLFLSQTIDDTCMPNQSKGNFTYIGYYEYEAMKGLIDNFDSLKQRFGVLNIKVRLHPAETEFRHQNLLKLIDGFNLEIERAQEKKLLESIAGARLVVGMNSTALFTSYLCGKLQSAKSGWAR